MDDGFELEHDMALIGRPHLPGIGSHQIVLLGRFSNGDPIHLSTVSREMKASAANKTHPIDTIVKSV